VSGVFFSVLILPGCAIDAEKVAISADGVEIRFDERGGGSPALIFVHGWGNNRSIWEAQVAYFSEQYKVINIDLPGFGESGGNRQVFTIESYGEDVATVIKRLDLDRAVLIGFSMGARVVIETADRVPEVVEGLILIEDLHDVEAPTPATAVANIERFYMDLVTSPSNEKLVKSGFYTKNTEASFLRISSMLEDAPRVGWSEALVDSIRWKNEECSRLLGQIRVPISAIYSELRPPNVNAFQKYVPSFQARIIPDTGHLVMWDAPEQFNSVLEESIQEVISQPR
jgi:pimeloyl-ACP methyl ester carboxylesterase